MSIKLVALGTEFANPPEGLRAAGHIRFAISAPKSELKGIPHPRRWKRRSMCQK